MTLRKTLATTALIASLAIPTLFAQQPSSPVAPTAAAATPALDPSEIHIDHYCRVLTQPTATAAHPNPQPRYRHNHIVCHLESQLSSAHWAEATRNGTTKRWYVTVREREYILQNTTAQPVTFVVAQPLPKGWSVDSDPQPTQVNGATATFRVVAQPAQIVRLHVGDHS